MKKILVPIDYSTQADNAVSYALQIAKKINATLHLFHAFEVPELIVAPDLVAPLTSDFSELKNAADAQMAAYVADFEGNPVFQDSYFPQIHFSTSLGIPEKGIDQAIIAQQPDLIIMGMQGKGRLNRFFLGSTSMEMIERVSVPTLLIPATANYQPIDKIAFATDLSTNDLNSIHQLIRLFCLYNPEILLVHVNERPPDLRNPRNQANQFLNRVSCHINYSRIYYRQLTERDINQGLKKLSENGQLKILSMIHRHPSIFSRLLEGSYTQKLARAIQMPLLVMPENNSPIGW